jgi:hypothetical protein
MSNPQQIKPEMYVRSWEYFFSPDDRVMALPCWKNPRLYLVSNGWKQRWSDSSFYPAFKLHARCFRWALRVLAACGFFITRKAGSADASERPPSFSEGRRMVLLRGADGPAQKMIARVVDKRTTQTVAYIKYAETDVAGEKINAERWILETLHEQQGLKNCESRGSIAPEVYGYGLFGNGMALEISAMKGSMLSAEVPEVWKTYRDSPLYGLLQKLHASETRYELDKHPVVKRMVRVAGDGFDLEPCLAPLRGRLWDAVVQHGDFTPWNILQRQDGALVAIDWEEGLLEGFPYFDFIYFVLQTGCLIHGWKPKRAFDYLLSRLVDEGLSREEVSSLVRLCALDAFFRFGADTGNAELQHFRKQIFAYTTAI